MKPSLPLLFLLMTFLLTGCSWMPFPIPFFGDDNTPQGKQAKTAQQKADLPYVEGSVSPKARMLIEEARTFWLDTGECLDPERASNLLDKAIELDPLDPAPYILRSRALSDLGYLDDAFSDATKAILLSPTAEAYATRGFICLRQNHPQGAERDFSNAEKIDIAEPLIYIYRAAGAFLDGREGDACDDLERACKYGNCQPWERAQKEKVCR